MVVEGAEQREECHAQQGVFGSEGWMVSGSALRRGKKCELGKDPQKQKDPFSVVLSALLLILKGSPKKGILKKTCCALNQVETSSRRLGAFSLISRGAPPREAPSAVKF